MPDHRVVGLQAVDHAFHEPLGHVFARVLLGNDPDLAFAAGTVACAQQLNVTPFDTTPGGQQFDARQAGRAFDQLIVAGAGIGFEIGEPGLRVLGVEREAQGFAIKLGRHPEPALLIIGRYRLITRPGFVVGRLPGVLQDKGVRLAWRQATGFEMEPLEVIAVGVRTNRQAHTARVTGIVDQDIAGIEIAVDVQRGQRHSHHQAPVALL
ncbi:hypothetical protein D9M71_395830 [compost metagenome]